MNWTAVSKKEHYKKTFAKVGTYNFFKNRSVSEICYFELNKAASVFPLFFSRINNVTLLFALMGLDRDKNLFVSEEGKWEVPRFLPAAMASYPFRIGQASSGDKILLYLEESRMITDDPTAIPLFDETGEPAAILQRYMKLLAAVESRRDEFQKSCELLYECGLLEPLTLIDPLKDWLFKDFNPLSLNFKAMRELSDKEFLELRESFALECAFAQHFSLENFHRINVLRGIKMQGKAMMSNLGTQIFDEEEPDLDFNLQSNVK